MKLSWILPAICTLCLGGVLANPVPDVGLSTCAAIARISTDLNNTNTYFSQINASLRTSPSGLLASELIDGLKYLKGVIQDLELIDLTPFPQLRVIKFIIPAIEDALQDRITTLETQVTSGKIDIDEIKSTIEMLAKSLDLAVTRFHDSPWVKSCEHNGTVKLEVLVGYFCNLTIAIEIILGAIGSILIPGFGGIISVVGSWICGLNI